MASFSDRIDSLVGTINNYVGIIEKYMDYTKEPIKLTAKIITYFFAGWGALGGLIIVSICIIDKGKCKLFWVCNHISWVLMHIITLAVMLICIAFTLVTFAIGNICSIIDIYYPDNLVSIPMVGTTIDNYLGVCISGDGDLINNFAP